MKARIKTVNENFIRNTGIILSVGMIVKNEEKNLKGCLDALKPLLDSVKSELIIVDTGSDDSTVEIAGEFTDKIYHFDWINDFSAARNFGLEKCSGEWFMYLDADDFFVDTAEMTDFFNNKNKSGRFNSAFYITKNFNTPELDSYFLSYQFRVARRTPTLRFIGSIHEGLTDSNLLPFHNFSEYVNHYGYVYENEEQRELKRKRNLELLEKELEKNPDDLRTLSLYVESYKTNDDKKASIIEHSLHIARTSGAKDPYIYSVFNNTVSMYAEFNQPEKILEISNEFLSKTKKNNAVLIDIYANKSIALAQMKKYAEAEEAFKKYFEYFNNFEKKLLDESDIVYNRVCYSTQEERKRLYGILEICRREQNRPETDERQNDSPEENHEAIYLALKNNDDLSETIKKLNHEQMKILLTAVNAAHSDLPSLALSYKNDEFFFSSIKNLLFGVLLFETSLTGANLLSAAEKALIYKRFSVYSSLYVCNVYNPALFNDEDIGALTETHRFGYYIGAAEKELETNNKAGYIKLLKDALISCKSMKNVIVFLLDDFTKNKF